jgi:hypothetical protein
MTVCENLHTVRQIVKAEYLVHTVYSNSSSCTYQVTLILFWLVTKYACRTVILNNERRIRHNEAHTDFVNSETRTEKCKPNLTI